MALTGYRSGGIVYHNTPAYSSALQAAIAQQNGGKTLHQAVLLAWLAHEGQVAGVNATDTNPLNIEAVNRPAGMTGNVGVNATFASPQAGIDATAHYLLTNPVFAQIRATMKPGGGTTTDALAQAASLEVWRSGNRGVPNAGGYSSLVADVARLLRTPLPAGAPLGPPLPSTATADQWNSAIACITAKHPGGGRTPTNIQASWIPDIISCAAGSGIHLTAADVTPYIGHTLSELRDGLAARKIIPPADPGKGIVPNINYDAIGTLLGGLVDPQNWLYGLALISGAFLAYKGFTGLSGAS